MIECLAGVNYAIKHSDIIDKTGDLSRLNYVILVHLAFVNLGLAGRWKDSGSMAVR